ncbi:MAG: hypothetical protein ACREJC_22175, partial [Tepidisphaeraceae bacterium]
MARSRDISETSRAAIVVAVATLLCFAPLCAHEFSWWDDWANIHQNKLLNPPTWKSLGHYWTHAEHGLYMPVTYTVWTGLATIARVGSPDASGISLNPWVFHTANVIVHVISALLAFAILVRLLNRERSQGVWAACLGALVFALHPV